MAWRIDFTPEALKDLRGLDRQVAIRIINFLNQRVAVAIDPRTVASQLKGPENEGKWRFRVGDYRIIARIENATVIITVIEIGHRRQIYR
jgi:mRNA interferase RelE/StbE